MDIYKYIFFPSVISYESAICFIRFFRCDHAQHWKALWLFEPNWLIPLFGHSVWTKNQKIVNGQGTAAKLFLCLIFFSGLS